MKRTTLSKALLSVSALALCAAMTPQSAQAAGFYIQEQSVKGLGSAFSGSVTNLNDPSTVYFNAAGMTKLQGTQGQLGVHIIDVDADLTDTGTAHTGGVPAVGANNGGDPGDPAAVPNAFVTHQISDDLWFGLGISAPFGLGSEYESNWFGRYDSIKSDLTTIDTQLSLAYKVNDKLALSGGVNIQRADAELTNAFFAGTEGLATLEGDDIGYGYNLGLMYEPTEKTTIGLSYRSHVAYDLEGSLKIEGSTGADRNDDATAALKTPDIATFGIAHDVNDDWTVSAQATWFGWNSFESIDADPESGINPGPTIQNYQTTWAYAVGAEYKYSDDWKFRAGFQYDETPTTDLYRTTRTPDGDRTWFSTGATYSWTDNIDLDLALTYIDVSSENVNVTRAQGAGSANVQANADVDVMIGALGLTYKF